MGLGIVRQDIQRAMRLMRAAVGPRVKLGAIDDIALDVGGTVLEVLDADAPADTAPDDEDETSAAGPIAIAVDVTEAEGEKEGGRADNPAP